MPAKRTKSKRVAVVRKIELAKGKTGAELGIQARTLKAKSAETILALAQTVGIAYAAFYEPWVKIGKPSVKIPEQKVADKHWADFLRESGYVWPRHYPLLRSLWMIHRKMDFLKPNSENLPNSIDAIKKIASVKLTDKQQKTLMKGLTESHTAKDVAALISRVKTGDRERFEELDAAGADALLSGEDSKSSDPKQSVLSMAADLIANETLISSDHRHAEASHQGFIVILCYLDPNKKQSVEVEVLADPDLVEEAIKLAHQKRTGAKVLKAA